MEAGSLLGMETETDGSTNIGLVLGGGAHTAAAAAAAAAEMGHWAGEVEWGCCIG